MFNNYRNNNYFQSPPVFTSPVNITSVSVNEILNKKKLAIAIDNSNQTRRSKDGRKIDPNTQLARELALNYRRYEPLHIRLRSLCTNTNHSGILNAAELTSLTFVDIVNMLTFLRNAGVIERFTHYTVGSIFVQFRNEAVDFYSKHFADIYICDLVRGFKPDEIYYDVTLIDTASTTYSTLKIDVVYRKGAKVNFVVSALSGNVLNKNQLERLTKIANRLKYNVTFVISPSVPCDSVRYALQGLVNVGVNFKVVTFANPLQFSLL